MTNYQRLIVNKNYSVLASILIIACTLCTVGQAHFIHIDSNDFRSASYPHAPLPYPPPSHPHPPQQQPAAKDLTPAEFMVDLSNDLTYRLLHYHSILNRNNFAFSPTALMSVLVALYEGAAGRSAMEMRNILQLPHNRDVIRIGYRDIHRRLRTYFFGLENPLKGLSLNRDNVTISRDYETILMFYGYDLGMDMVSSTMVPTTTAATAMPMMNNLTITTTDMPTTTTAATTMPTLATTLLTDTETTTAKTTVTISNTTELVTTTEISSPTTIATETTTSMPVAATEPAVETTESQKEEMEKTTETPTENVDDDAAKTGNDEAAELISSFVAEADAEPFLRIQKARVTRLPSGKLQAPAATPKANYLPTARSTAAFTKSRIANRNKRHVYGYKDLDASLLVTLLQPQNFQQSFYPVSGTEDTETFIAAAFHNEFEAEAQPNYLSSSGSGNTGNAPKQNYNTDMISHVFYLNRQQIIHTTFKVYNAVLYYKYFENLKLSALELELNTPEYNLLILLPDFNTDLVSAAASLHLGATLRLMRKELKPRWVQAIIPDFKLHGTMFLTNDLQNMGICDIFEPNRADFRPMTDEKGIYVKHIEQLINMGICDIFEPNRADFRPMTDEKGIYVKHIEQLINVNIRTRPINQLKRNSAQQARPIQISVNHPFMFFIIDRDLDVAVMAGRILNPLNVRIQ